MAQQTGNCLNVGTIIKDIHRETVPGTMPADVLIYAGQLHPMLHGLTTALVGGQSEDYSVLILPFGNLSYQLKKAIIERCRDPTF